MVAQRLGSSQRALCDVIVGVAFAIIMKSPSSAGEMLEVCVVRDKLSAEGRHCSVSKMACWALWATMAVLVTLSIVPLTFGVIGLVEGGGAAGLPVLVSILAMILYVVFAGKRWVIFDTDAREVSVQFRQPLRKTAEERELGQVAEVLLYKESDESQPGLVDPYSQPRMKRVRYRSPLRFQDGSDLSLNGTATKGTESHRIAQTVLKRLGDRAVLSDPG